jgi:hypothetical protein
MLPQSFYNNARHEARFHVQVRLDAIHASPPGPRFFPVEATVVRVFRGDTVLKPGDPISFDLPVAWPEDEIPAGGVLWQSFAHVSNSSYAEVFLNGDPPRCEIALSQCLTIDAPSDTPHMQGSFPAINRRHKWYRAWVRWFGAIV